MIFHRHTTSPNPSAVRPTGASDERLGLGPWVGEDMCMGMFDFLGKRSSGLSVEEALVALSKGAVLIDVRTRPEYEAGHAPGARPVDPKSLHDDPVEAVHGDDLFAERDAAIVVMRDNGLRSSIAAAELRGKGLLAESVAGGLRAWAKDGNPVIPGPYRRR